MFQANQPLRPHHLRTPSLAFSGDADAVQHRRALLGNDDVRISFVVATVTSPLYRNAVGDECLYIEDGTAVI